MTDMTNTTNTTNTPTFPALAVKVHGENEARKTERAQEEASKITIPEELLEGCVEVGGEVLKAEWRDHDFGSSKKALLKVSTDDGHFLLWGTLASDILEAERGDWIVFTARISKSNDDQSFGFWSRPTKARIES